MRTLEEAIGLLKSDIKYNQSIGNDTSCEEQHLGWLEELKTVENIMLIYNANWYADEDNGVPDSEVLESIWNVIQDNGLDIDIEQDYRKGKVDGYNKAIDDFYNALADDLTWLMGFGEEVYISVGDNVRIRAEQLKEGGENE